MKSLSPPPGIQMILLLDAEATVVEDFSTGCSARLALHTQLLQLVAFLFSVSVPQKEESGERSVLARLPVLWSLS